MIKIANGKIFVTKHVYSILNVFIAPQQVIGFSKETDALGSVAILDGIRIPRHFKLVGTNEEDWENVSTSVVRYGATIEELWFVDAPDLIEIIADPSVIANRKMDAFALGKLMEFFKEVRKSVSERKLAIERWTYVTNAKNIEVWGIPIGVGTYSGIPSGYKRKLTDDSVLEGYVVLDILPASRI